VFTGQDLLISHYDGPDLGWEDVAERTEMESLRGLVVAQATILDDLIDEFLLYLIDPGPQDWYRIEVLRSQPVGRKLDHLRSLLRQYGLADVAARYVQAASEALSRRDVLAHSPLFRQPTRILPIEDIGSTEYEMVIRRRTKKGDTFEVVTEDSLTNDLYNTQGTFSGLLAFAEIMVERVPVPVHFQGGSYLAAPTP
jgi:hypothetical protein